MTTTRMLLVMVGMALCLGPTMTAAIPPPESSARDTDRMVALQYAASHGDRSQISTMVQLLSAPRELDYRMTLLHSLAMLGAAEALPAIDNLIKTDKEDPILVTYAKVARARLVAEDAARNVTDPKAKAAAKVRRFYEELDLTPDDINSAVTSYKADVAAHRNEADYAAAFTPPLESILELADMVYQSNDYQAYAALPEIRRVDFTALPGPALKMRLALLSRQDRIKTIVQEIANSSYPRDEGNYEMQLLADEGDAGRQAVAAELPELHAREARAPRMPNAPPGIIGELLGTRELNRVLEISGGPIVASAVQAPSTDAQVNASTHAPGPASKTSGKDLQRQIEIAY